MWHHLNDLPRETVLVPSPTVQEPAQKGRRSCAGLLASGGVLETIHGPSYFGSYSVVYSTVFCVQVLKIDIKVWWCTKFCHFNSSSWKVKAARFL